MKKLTGVLNSFEKPLLAKILLTGKQKIKKMKTIVKITGAVIISLILVSLLVMFSSFRQRDKVQIRNQIMHEVIAYADKQIIPVIKPLRENAEQKLSPADRTEIASARQQLRDIRETRWSAGLMPVQISEMNRELTEAETSIVKETRKQFRKEIMKVWAIADKYEEMISSELNAAKPYFETWREDIRAITSEQTSLGFLDMIPSSKIALFKQFGLAEEIIPVVFLLYNPDIPLTELESVLNSSLTPVPDVQVYPNPATDECCFEFNLKQDEMVQISLYDKNGNFLEGILAGELAKGFHRECISLSSYPEGMALALITFGEQKVVKTIIIK